MNNSRVVEINSINIEENNNIGDNFDYIGHIIKKSLRFMVLTIILFLVIFEIETLINEYNIESKYSNIWISLTLYTIFDVIILSLFILSCKKPNILDFLFSKKILKITVLVLFAYLTLTIYFFIVYIIMLNRLDLSYFIQNYYSLYFLSNIHIYTIPLIIGLSNCVNFFFK